MRLTIYVPEDMGRRIKTADVNISRLCQEAIRRELERKEAVLRGAELMAMS